MEAKRTAPGKDRPPVHESQAAHGKSGLTAADQYSGAVFTGHGGGSSGKQGELYGDHRTGKRVVSIAALNEWLFFQMIERRNIMNRIANILYRPTENHVGVIYRFGRFNRFVDPDRWAFTCPFLESVFDETKLDMRTAQISFADVYTSDHVALDVDLKVFYLVDLREANEERRLQVLRFPTEGAWDEIVRTNLNDVARNQVFAGKYYEELVTPDGRGYLKQALSGALEERVRGFGILMNPRFAVNIVNIQPNSEFKKALMEESAAKALGTAAAERLTPVVQSFLDQKQEQAVVALIMQIASAVVKTGQIPDVMFPDLSEHPAGGIFDGNGRGSNFPGMRGFPPSPRKPKSIAGD
jgi:regulator of protease activity HflC (stomatin/prohibitin superfamily)